MEKRDNLLIYLFLFLFFILFLSLSLCLQMTVCNHVNKTRLKRTILRDPRDIMAEPMTAKTHSSCSVRFLQAPRNMDEEVYPDNEINYNKTYPQR